MAKTAFRERLWPYLGGSARENGLKALAIGGVADYVHVHLRISFVPAGLFNLAGRAAQP